MQGNQEQQHDEHIVADYIEDRLEGNLQKQVKANRNGIILLGAVIVITRLYWLNKLAFTWVWWWGICIGFCFVLLAAFSMKKPLIAFSAAVILYIFDIAAYFVLFGDRYLTMGALAFRIVAVLFLLRGAVTAKRLARLQAQKKNHQN
jgi:hypothetical protein